MIAEGLSLFNLEELNKQATTEARELHKIPDEKIVTPLVKVLDQAIPTSNSKTDQGLPSVKQSLDELFPEQQYEEKNLKRAKEILGSLAEQFTEEQLKDEIAKTQYLAEAWLDDFERSIFKGQTLKEMLHEKGGK